MYGHFLKAYRGLLDYSVRSTGYVNAYDEMSPYSLTSTNANSVLREVQGKAIGLFSKTFVRFAPLTVYERVPAYMNSAFDNNMNLLLDSALIEALETEYYDRQVVSYFNHNDLHSESPLLIHSHNAMFAASNMPATVSVLTDMDAEEGAEYIRYGGSGANLTTITTRGIIYQDMRNALADFFYRHQPDYYAMVIPSDLTLSVQIDTLGADYGALAAYSSHDIVINSAFKSRFYINDYRDYVYQRPIVSLNTRWYLPQTAVSAFAEQYFRQ
jgi:hypothetical protein